MLRHALLAALVGSFTLAACADDSHVGSNDDDIISGKVDDEWFYSGSLQKLDAPSITVSLAGHTAHVVGYYPAGTKVPDLPHVKARPDAGGRVRLDIVYPIATAAPGKDNSKPGMYSFQLAKPYRPNGIAWTQSDGYHQVPWGGFPFLEYNNGIAFHGPITDTNNKTPDDLNVWYLRRGDVSSGCNRMMGEHVVELAHILGISMRKLYAPNVGLTPTTTAQVNVIADYDTLDGKYIDVDYPTDTGAKRPGTVYGTDKVVMFGSWVATEMPDGKDLPPNMKWEGGVSGKWYDFEEHAVQGVVCSMPKTTLAGLRTATAKLPNNELPPDFCARKMACEARLKRTCQASEIGL